MMLYTKYKSSEPCSFRQKDFWKLHFENLLFDPVTYLYNKLELFEQFRFGSTQFGQIPISGLGEVIPSM